MGYREHVQAMLNRTEPDSHTLLCGIIRQAAF